MNSFKGGVAFVTGASEGMGKATSLYLSELGADVVFAARRLEITKELAGEVRKKFGTDPLALKVDVTFDLDVKSGIEAAIRKYGRIDYIANFAGNLVGYLTLERRKPIHEQHIEHLKEIAEVDHFGTTRVLKYALPDMISRRFGKIVLVSAITSVYGYSEDVDHIPYKRANEGLALSTALRSEREEGGVDLYTVAPCDVFNPSTWNSYNEEERIEAVRYGVIQSKSVAMILSWLFSGKLTQRYEMKVNLDTGEVIDAGKYVPLKNGDTIVLDVKTIPKLFHLMGEGYELFRT